jgi:UPF0755 protein
MTEDTHSNTPEEKEKRKNLIINVIIYSFFLLGIITWTFFYYSNPPNEKGFPITLQVEKGMSVKAITELAKDKGLVRSDLFLYAIITSWYDPTNIHAGRYRFDEPWNVFKIASKLANNEVDELLITVTIPEGVTNTKISEIASPLLPNFDTEEFAEQAEKDEGYLFPDTYFIPESYDSVQFISLLKKTFQEKVRPLELAATSSEVLSGTDYVTLASIIEREANDEESMKMVAGILINRLKIDMPLQADASIEYVIDKPLNELRPGELANYLQTLDSPYNTYKYRGLPPTPIGNPGLMAMEAVFFPTDSDYLFYLTDEEGNFHYAKTLQEHNRNVATYLR